MLNTRPGEIKLGETLGRGTCPRVPLFGLIGVSEDVGPRANFGKSGAANGWQAFIDVFSNMQSNDFLSGENIINLGEIDLGDLQKRSLGAPIEELREIVSEIDNRIEAAVSSVIKSGLIPIVVGGGHNNAYPIIKSLSTHESRPIVVVNLDPHSDCRALEGRHSGNPFSYAFEEGLIDEYILIGMDTCYNNQYCIDFLKSHNSKHITLLELLKSEAESKLINKALADPTGKDERPCFLTIDCDAISNMPASASTNIGLAPATAFKVIESAIRYKNVKAIFIAEAGPSKEDPTEMKAAGKFQAYCVYSAISHLLR